MKKILIILTLIFTASIGSFASEENGASNKVDPKAIIFAHLGDAYGWEVPFCHDIRIPLPIIVRSEDNQWHCFSSHNIEHGNSYNGFKISDTEEYHGKVVGVTSTGDIYRPLDFSITKNVLALIISAIVVLMMVFSVLKWYKKNQMKAPRKGTAFMEFLVEFIYDGVIKSTLGNKAKHFAPYLLTVFFFILVMNLLGLIVIFPGGANLTGNVAITMSLALCTFIATNLNKNKHYWKDIFWPDVPIWLKFPIPIMPIIEVFGIFTKPAALLVRLFANMMGGHMIVIVLISLIFIFTGLYGVAVGGATTVVSLLFSLFMLIIDVLVSFVQAYVFTMLSTIFISLSQEGSEEHNEMKDEIAIENK